MSKRRRMSRRASKVVFKKYTGYANHPVNTSQYVVRGGIRM